MYQEGKALQQYHGKTGYNQKPESMPEKYWELIINEKETIAATGKVETHMIVSLLISRELIVLRKIINAKK